VTDFTPAERQRRSVTEYLLTWRTTNIPVTLDAVLNLDIAEPVITIVCHDDTADATVTVRVKTRDDMIHVARVFDIPYTA